MSKSIYRPRGADTVRISASLSTGAVEAADRIRVAFAQRYPKGQCPTLSAVLEATLKRYAGLLADPDQADAEAKDFERRYLKRS